MPNTDYMDGTKLPTAFASGEGPDLFIISPGDFLRYYNGGVLQDLTPFMEQEAIDDFFPDVLAYAHGRRQDLSASRWRSSRWRCTTTWRPGTRPGSPTATSRRPGTSCSRSGKKLTTDQRFGVLFETTPGYYQNFTWYPFMWQGGGRDPDAGRQQERHARSGRCRRR